MGFAHQLTHAFQIPPAKSARRVQGALIFMDHMGAPFPNGGGKLVADSLQQFDGNIPQSTNRRVHLREISHALLTFLAALVISAGREIVLNHRIAHNQFYT